MTRAERREKNRLRQKARYRALTPLEKTQDFERRWAASLRKHGMTPRDYMRILQAQHGLCAICGRSDNGGKKFCVDHCHVFGRVRGLLCTRCNKGLGIFGDDPERLARAAEYLKENHLGRR